MPTPADAPPRRSGPFLTPGRRRSLQSIPAVAVLVFGDGRDRVVQLLFSAVVLLTSGWMALGSPGVSASGIVRLLPAALLATAVAVLARRAAAEYALDQGTRKFWRVVAVAMVVQAGAPLFAQWLVLIPSPGAAQAVRLGAPHVFAALLLAGFLALPTAPRTTADRRTLWLDAFTVAVGGLLVLWFDVSVASRYGAIGSMSAFVAMHIDAIVALVLILVASVLWKRTLLKSRGDVLLLIALSVLVPFVATVTRFVMVLRGESAPVWLAAATPMSTACVGAAAWLTCTSAMSRQVRSRSQRETFGVNLIPYVAVLPGFGLLLLLAFEQGTQPLLGLVLGAAVLTILAFLRQLTGTREAVRALTESATRNNEARFQALVQHASDVIMVLDTDGTICYVSPSMASVFGHDPAKLLGTNISALLHPGDVEHACEFLRELARSVRVTGGVPAAAGALKREWRIAHADGRWMTADNVGTNLLQEPVIRGLVLNTRDVSEQSVLRQQYMHQAFHDPLTDLANRSLFLYQVGHALVRTQRNGETVAVLFLDLDNFKTVNDSLGHAAGDRLLVEASRRLSSCVREGDLIARLGGDEFAVLVEEAERAADVHEIAERIGAAMSRPFKLQGKEVFVNASIGIARSEHGETSDVLVRNADVAMYVAKNRGKGQHVWFEPAMHRAALDRLVVEADLRRAIEHEEFFLCYQPIVELATGEIIGAEALVRWMCRDRGTVPPGVFIPIAEETGLIVAIGRWVLRRACLEAVRWTKERGLPVRITVNLSGRQLQEAAIVDEVRQALAETGLDPGQLVLEITESMLMENTAVSMDRLTALKALGVSLAIDDFGTGYSSLSYLQRYPVDILKIDKAFVDLIDKGGDGPVLARAIVALGETLRMITVAEGIETEAQRSHLLELGCELGQGYLFAPPLEAEEFWSLLLARGARAPYAVRRHRTIDAQAA